MNKLILVLAAAALVCCSTPRYEKVPVIFDTDLGNDVDDAIALAMLYRYADLGRADILAMGLSKGAKRRRYVWTSSTTGIVIRIPP